MKPNERAIARLRLDERLRDFPDSLLATPPRGWIVALREAIGMSVRELGERMGTSGQRVSRLEHDEISGRIQLSTLERAAAALNCRVAYVLIPNDRSLESTVRVQARKKAAEAVRKASGTMALEDQSVLPRYEAEQIEALAEQFLNRRGLWSSADD